MRRISRGFVACLILGVGLIFLVLPFFRGTRPTLSASADQTGPLVTSVHASTEEAEEESGPERERAYFDAWFEPYGALLPRDVLEEVWSEIDAVPREEEERTIYNHWTLMGPSGTVLWEDMTTVWSGRILDIDLSSNVRVAAASGGLWEHGSPPVPLSDAVPSLAIGSFANQPGSGGQTIVIGTGEPSMRSGRGIWRTTNRGVNWTRSTMSPFDPAAVYRVRFTPDNANIVHAATTNGYYRSTDGGMTWNATHFGDCTDVAVSLDFLQIVYCSISGDGLYRSIDRGLTWTKVTAPGLPTTNIGRTAISMAVNPSYLYISIVRDDNDQTLGVFRTTNAGTSWTNVSPPSDIHWGLGWYANTIGICPGNASICLVGGGALMRTTDGGASWTDAGVHADDHAVAWQDANTVYVGNDGGMVWSLDAGATWRTAGNTFPITQYVNIHTGVNNTNVVWGGTQDNGLSGTTDGGGIWWLTEGGDGGGVTIDPSNAANIWATCGFFNEGWAWERLGSTNTGFFWSHLNNGVDPDQSWFTEIRNDQVAPVYLYTNAGPYVYKSTNAGAFWSKLNAAAFPERVNALSVSRYQGGTSVVYAPLADDQPPRVGEQLRVYDAGTWYERASGLSTATTVHRVKPHPTEFSTAYAMMGGFRNGEKVYVTTDRGVSWTNISGDLPNVPMGDLVVHPTNNDFLCVGTAFGCYRTTNGGANWVRWNAGLPEATIVTEMTTLDRRQIDGTYYVVAGTYGRSIWKREISGEDAPTSIADGSSAQSSAITGLRGEPNPCAGAASISFTLSKESTIDLRVYNAAGRQVVRTWNGRMGPGHHAIPFDASHLAAGVYWARVRAATTEAKVKIVVAR